MHQEKQPYARGTWSVHPQDGLPTLYLHPGDLAIVRNPCRLTTILGSCVAICLWDRERGIGGMNHYLLPSATGTPEDEIGRYGKSACEVLFQRLVGAGAEAKRLTARMYGGANVIRGMVTKGLSLGDKNILVAEEFLQHYQIPILTRDVAGVHGRKIVFYPHKGDVEIKLLGTAG